MTLIRRNTMERQIFAEEVVAKHAKDINFSGFKPLLANMCAVIKEHAQKVTVVASAPPE